MAGSGYARSMARVSSLHEAFARTDRRRLARALSPRLSGRMYRRVAAVLAIADGERFEEVARRLRVTRRAVYRWVTRYLARRDPRDLVDKPRAGRPRHGAPSPRLLRRLLATDPRTLGYQSATWTAPLLAAHCARHGHGAVDARTIRRRLHELGYRWKRPRYRYAHRAAHLAQKKGLSAVA